MLQIWVESMEVANRCAIIKIISFHTLHRSIDYMIGSWIPAFALHFTIHIILAFFSKLLKR